MHGKVSFCYGRKRHNHRMTHMSDSQFSKINSCCFLKCVSVFPLKERSSPQRGILAVVGTPGAITQHFRYRNALSANFAIAYGLKLYAK